MQPVRRERGETGLEPFEVVFGRGAVVRRAHIDTDQLAPKRFLRRITRTGYEDALFADWRTRSDGTRDETFSLNHKAVQGATFLFAGPDFGCGSSREHAVWALMDSGFRAVFAPSFGDIFRQNCVQNGLLPAAIAPDVIAPWLDFVESRPDERLTADLRRQMLWAEGLGETPFDIPAPYRERLLGGLDEIGITLARETDIRAFEARAGAASLRA